MTHLPPNVYFDVPDTKKELIKETLVQVPHSEEHRLSRFVDPAKADLPWLISRFGDACSTSWLERRYKIWRGEESTWEHPKVQGYLEHGRWVFAWGNPLCRPTRESRRDTIVELVRWASHQRYRVVWCCVSSEVEGILAEGVEGSVWSTVSCLREDVLSLEQVNFSNRDVKQNLRRSRRGGVSCDELRVWDPDFVPEEKTRSEIERGIDLWRTNQHGRQIASAGLDPWLDSSNRRYFIARTSHEIVGFCILSPVANNSFQIKSAIQFMSQPSAPHGTSEALLVHVIKEMQAEGRPSITFGPSAIDHLVLEHNIKRGFRTRLLEKGYACIIRNTALTERGQFRSKFETDEGQLLHVSFPHGGFGLGGLWALMHMLKA